MKKLLLFLTLSLNILILNAQSGVIYNLAFKIDSELVTQMQAQNKNYKFLNVATIEDMPKELSDTIALLSEQAIGEYLKASLSSIMPKEKLIMGALPEHLMYLPANTFKKALRLAPDNDYYIDIFCHIAARGGVAVTIGSKRRSKLKPKLTLKIRVYDKDKTLVQTKEAVLKDFEALRSKSFDKTYGIRGLAQNTDRVTVSETIDAEDVLKMYLLGIEAALK
jgi:cell division protein FtsB